MYYLLYKVECFLQCWVVWVVLHVQIPKIIAVLQKLHVSMNVLQIDLAIVYAVTGTCTMYNVYVCILLLLQLLHCTEYMYVYSSLCVEKQIVTSVVCFSKSFNKSSYLGTLCAFNNSIIQFTISIVINNNLYNKKLKSNYTVQDLVQLST